MTAPATALTTPQPSPAAVPMPRLWARFSVRTGT